MKSGALTQKLRPQFPEAERALDYSVSRKLSKEGISVYAMSLCQFLAMDPGVHMSQIALY